ncbi:MAG TPA: MauE/DoxX family redox-associated membrane protein [Candidatus Dormibacteraeota bacterium]|nr:MauE/DoxX family redox-associated membrane protein [Candidatus Dormibacteraeota bacterium]
MPTIDPAISWTLSLALALVFGTSAMIKFVDFSEFRGALENYRIVPEELSLLAAAIVPISEFGGAIGLLIPRFHAAAAILLIFLLAIFTAAIAINMMRGRLYIDCGCFGPMLRQPLSTWLLVRNGVLMLLGALALLSIDARAITALDVVTITLGASTLVILYGASNYLLANLPASNRMKRLAMEPADA